MYFALKVFFFNSEEYVFSIDKIPVTTEIVWSISDREPPFSSNPITCIVFLDQFSMKDLLQREIKKNYREIVVH